MEKKLYNVGVTVIEGRDLKGKDSSGTSDPLIKISVGNLKPQVSQIKHKANAAVWNQSFTFPDLSINQYEMETFEILIEAFDYNSLASNELIGYSSIGLSTLYRNLNHEFHRIWVTLFNPEHPNEIQGYLLVSCYIVGQHQRPPAHALDEDILDDEEQYDEDALAGLSEEQKIRMMKRKGGVFLLQNPMLNRKGYQLSVNVLKAEGLPSDGSGTCNSFISVRAVGAVQTTKIVDDNYNPNYNSRICFPVWMPGYNDKIVVRVWSRGNRMSDTFIANIPEFPSAHDMFNISQLLSHNSQMKSTWFNLYGTHPSERGWFTQNKKSKKEGSCYLGRVLISMHFGANEHPQLLTTMAQAAREPLSQKYRLWVDTYDLVNCDVAKGQEIWVTASIGSFQSGRHPAKYNKDKKIYQWPKISIKSLDVDYPHDLKQTPDIIINVYSESGFLGFGTNRIGYIRIPARECQKKNPQPQWYRLRSPQNDTTCPGIILMNVQYLPETAAIDRFPKQRGVEGSYKVFAQILQGFEIAPSYDEANLNTKVDIQIGNIAAQKEGITTDTVTGRYPSWNSLKIKEIVLDKDLQFASDMRVLLYNCTKGMFLRRETWDVIGEFSVPVTSISKKLYSKPQFFNVINNQGQLQGQVLARFFLKEIDQRRKRDDITGIVEEFNQLTRIAFKVNIFVSLVGIRNLLKNIDRPIITIRLTNDPQQRQQVFRIEDLKYTTNPNFGKQIKFENVELPFEPLLWPQLEITVTKEGIFWNDQEYTTISIFPYADFLRPEDIKFSEAQLNKNQNKINLVQKQINPMKVFLKQQREVEKEGDNHQRVGSNIVDDTDSDDSNDTEYGINMVGGMRIKEFDQSQEFDDIAKYYYQDEDDEEVNPNEVQLDWKRASRSAKRIDDSDDEEMNIKSNQKSKERMKSKTIQNHQEGVHVDIDNIIDIACTPESKAEEERIRQLKIKELENRKYDIEVQIQYLGNSKKKEQKMRELHEIQSLIRGLEDERMNENKFWNYGHEEEHDPFNYGREIIRDSTYENMLHLPYSEFPLFTNSFFGGKTAQVGGMLRSGELTGATLKAAIVVKRVADDSEDGSDSDEENQPQNKLDYKTPGGEELDKVSDDNESEQDGEKKQDEDKELKVLKKIEAKYPFDITQQRFMQNIIVQRQFYKIRVYLLTCQNLSAVDNHVDLKSRLAGAQALSSADPFPVIIVGDGKNDTKHQTVKYVNEREKCLEKTLNPQFFRAYEFDAQFPEDWKVEIQIFDKGRLFSDSLIGSTTIDLEDRYYGNFRRQMLQGLEIYMKIEEDLKMKEELQDMPNKKFIEQKKKKVAEIQEEIKKIQDVDSKPVPVEFRELRHPQKKQAQGMIEMWCEVLTQDEARRTPMTVLMQQQKEQYEIRMVIWETRDIPLVNGDSVDIYVKATFDPTSGLKGYQQMRETDTHCGSKDGRGVFNYRMKFDLETPCEFPRMTLAVFDYGLISDEAIGEGTLNLRSALQKLRKEGYFTLDKTWVPLKHPNKVGQDRGEVLISLSVITKAEADGRPVGEGQNEPNENPKLVKPEEGRNISDKIITIANVDVGKIRFPKLNMWRNFIIVGVVIAIIIIVLIVIMFLK